MELPELRRRVRLMAPGQMPDDALLSGLRERVGWAGFGGTANALRLSGDTLKGWLSPPPPVIPLDIPTVRREERNAVRNALLNFPRGASAPLLASRSGLTTSRAEIVLGVLVHEGQATEHIGKYRLVEAAW